MQNINQYAFLKTSEKIYLKQNSKRGIVKRTKFHKFGIVLMRLEEEFQKLDAIERKYFEIVLIEVGCEFYFCKYRTTEIRDRNSKKIEREIVGISEDLPEYLQNDEKERLIWKLDSLRLLQAKIIKLNFG